MAENTIKKKKENPDYVNDGKKALKLPTFSFAFFKDRRFHLIFGFFLMFFSVFLLFAFISYIFTGRSDQSVLEGVEEVGKIKSSHEIENWLGYLGAYFSNLFIYRWFGISSFLFVPIFFITGYNKVFQSNPIPQKNFLRIALFGIIWISVTLGNLVSIGNGFDTFAFLGGAIGYECSMFLSGFFGWGSLLLLFLVLIAFLVYNFNVTGFSFFDKAKHQDELELDSKQDAQEKSIQTENTNENDLEEDSTELNEIENQHDENENEEEFYFETNTTPKQTDHKEDGAIELIIEESHSENDEQPEALTADDVLNSEKYDSTLDLPKYVFPTLDLLIEYSAGKVQVSREELEANSNKIVETLSHYSIGIASIKATIGPTVTLYEIVPESGVRISKIKNLEDDIALSLAALGIRIIAPIPGKGTIGIEVPNTNPETVSMREVIASDKFINAKYDLPIALGKTISNDVFITDLAKMPHLLMAGATGQGKSVGLNCILASLLYKKHPSQLKFVLVDPKKVELTLYNQIERHFLAKLPDGEEAIITDTSKVINTLNSLCIEMDTRYDLLKEAQCRNLKEYNSKFVERRLNPENDHRYLPFIVLVIDELADLMMTAGKEVETPIARLAQLARAIGIHLIVATQRPSVNVITGIIKANFPARLSFRVTSKIDSRTILDTGGADQLIGKGDMLLSLGSDLIRIQCAFVDTPEVEKICNFIGEQQGYSSAYLLPEFKGDESGSSNDIDLSERDKMFEEAAKVIVIAQQGSTSLIQRKLKLGYNRAGRIMDQLEAFGIVGPFEGSKAREVLIPDLSSLEQKLRSLDE